MSKANVLILITVFLDVKAGSHLQETYRKALALELHVLPILSAPERPLRVQRPRILHLESNRLVERGMVPR